VSAAARWAVGVDGGATRGRAWAATVTHDPLIPPVGHAEHEEACNPYAVGAERAAAAILRVIDSAWQAAGAPAAELARAFVTVGVAGVERAGERTPLSTALHAGGLAPERLDLQGDPWVALEGALPPAQVGHGARVLLVAGTGSVAVAICEDGHRRRVGGWGSRVGDEGSGAWLGSEAVRATLRALDGRDPPGVLAQRVQAAWGSGSEALVVRARTATPAEFGTLAPLVLGADDDPAAAALRSRAVAYLAELVTAAAAGCSADPVALALAGGVARALEAELALALPEPLAAALRPPVGPPVAGAWRLACARALAAGT
jgi:glucosamine kinase